LSPFCPPHQQSQPKTVDLKGATRDAQSQPWSVCCSEMSGVEIVCRA